jgi:putative N-acetylmannosamine-6-phosphate epimerase
MGAMALAARDGGAVAIRANGPEDIVAVRAAGLPVIGIHKVFSDRYPVYITPHFAAAAAIVAAGATIVALDCTNRPRDGEAPAVLVRRIREELGAEVFADISTVDEGLAAADLGATYVATTLSGYTEATQPKPAEPDLA